jgi:hypothetical protein
MIIEILFVVTMFLWFLALLPFQPVEPYRPYATTWLAFVAILLLGVHVFAGYLVR